MRDIKAMANNAFAIMAARGADVDVELTRDINVEGVKTGVGIGGEGTDTKVKVRGLNDLMVTGDFAGGIGATEQANVDVELQGSADVFGTKESYGIAGRYGGVVNTTFTGTEGDLMVTVTDDLGFAEGIFADGNKSNVTVNNLHDLTVLAHDFAEGVSSADGSKIKATMTGDITVIADGPEGYAYGIVGEEEGTEVDVKGIKDIVVRGTDSAEGVVAENSASVNVELTGDMAVAGEDVIGIDAADGGKINVTGIGTKRSKLNVEGVPDASGNYSEILINAVDGSLVNARNLEGVADTAINSFGSGGRVNLYNTSLEGNIVYLAGDDGEPTGTLEDNVLDINLDEMSEIISSANVIGDPLEETSARINIQNRGRWEVTGNSDMRGTLDNETSRMDFRNTNPTEFITVKTGNVVNNDALMNMNLGLVQDKTDKITAKRTVAGSGADIYVQDLDPEGAPYRSRMTDNLLEGSDGLTGTYRVLNNGDNKYVRGNWQYSVKQDGKSAYLATTDFSNRTKTAISGVINPDVWYIENEGLYSQMDHFTASRKNYDVWARGVRSKVDVTGVGTHSGFAGTVDVKTNFNGVTFGADRMISSSDKSNTWAGVTMGYGTGSEEYLGGDTDIKSFYAGLYTVYKNDKNFYLSGILKFNRYKVESDTEQWNYQGIDVYSGDYSQNGYGISILAGKKFMQPSGFYVEPQLEFGYEKISGADYNLDNMKVRVDGTNSTRLRLGVGIGKEFTYTNGNTLNVGLKASLVHEFGGETNIKAFNDTFVNDYGGTWGQYKFAVDYKQKNGFAFGFDLGVNRGGRRTSPVNIGVNAMWSF